MRPGIAAVPWGLFALLLLVPLGLALQSPLLAWREPIYIIGGFAGVVGLALLLVQPVLAAGLLPGLSTVGARRLHRWGGLSLVLCVGLHVGGLWVTSPPDVVDVLLFRSPTPFAIWGALALWAVFGAGALALARHRLGWHTLTWRRAHVALAFLTILGTVLHSLQIQGTMEPVSRALLCAALIAATFRAMQKLRIWSRRSASKH